MNADRRSVRYCSTPEDDAILHDKLRAPANQLRRFGYRGLYILLRREPIASTALMRLNTIRRESQLGQSGGGGGDAK